MDKRDNDMKENYNLLVAKKTEKIVTAIYLISQFLSDKENLKQDVRKEANLLLKNINAIAYVDDKNFEESSKNIFVLYKLCLDNVSLIISYLFVARDSNLISKMNVNIVIDGLRILENILIKKQFTFNEDNLLIQEENILREIMFDTREDRKQLNTSFDSITERNKYVAIQDGKENNTKNALDKYEEVIKKDLSNFEDINDNIKRQNKNIENINDNITFSTKTYIKNNDKYPSFKKEKDSKKDIENNKELVKKEINKQTKPRKSENRKQNRRDQILSLFTKGVEISIHDISKKVVGCSIKTLQRELNTLVIDKKIDRIGDKRWSKYILL